MEAEEIHRTLKRQPFEPIRIHISDGASYDVTHPDQVIVTKRWSYIGLGGTDGGPFQNSAVVTNLHITRLEPLRRSNRGTKRK
jgi:hypothetical protein